MIEKEYHYPFPVSESEFLALGRKYSQYEGTALLHSGKGYDKHLTSYLALFPISSIVIEEEDPWEKLQKSLTFSKSGSALPEYIGFLSYEMGAFSHLHKKLPFKRKEHPLAIFYKPLILLRWDRSSSSLSAFIHQTDAELSEDACKFMKDAKVDLWDALFKGSEEPLSDFSLEEVKASSQSDYENLYHKVKEHLLKGDIYQVCLTREEVHHINGHPFDWFASLNKQKPMPFMAYISTKEGVILSSSPERFLKKSGSTLLAEPIKGTISREQDAKLDHEAKEKLMCCEKNSSELVMITDLMRNDLSQVCKIGSVHVPNLKRCDQFPYVWHLVSEIKGELKNSIHPLECLQASFPPGSISGCPKIRAQKIIHDLEDRSRGIYTGAIGYFDSLGDFDFNVAIRTVWINNKKEAYVQAGGAVLSESNIEEEWKETIVKMEGITQGAQCISI